MIKPFEDYSLNGFSIYINLYTFYFTLSTSYFTLNLNNHLFYVIKHVLRRYFG